MKLEEIWATYERHIVVFAHGCIFTLVVGPGTVGLDKAISSVMIEAVHFAQGRRLVGHLRK